MSRFESVVRSLLEEEEKKTKTKDKHKTKPTLDVDDDASKGELDAAKPKDDGKKKDGKKAEPKPKRARIPGRVAAGEPTDGEVPDSVADNLGSIDWTVNDDQGEDEATPDVPAVVDTGTDLIPLDGLPDVLRDNGFTGDDRLTWIPVASFYKYQNMGIAGNRIKDIADSFYMEQLGITGQTAKLMTDIPMAGSKKTDTVTMGALEGAIKANGRMVSEKSIDAMTMEALGFDPRMYKVVNVEVWDAYGHMFMLFNEEHTGRGGAYGKFKYIVIAEGKGTYEGHARIETGSDVKQLEGPKNESFAIRSAIGALLLERNVINDTEIKTAVLDPLIAHVPADSRDAPNNEVNIKKWINSNVRNWMIDGYGVPGKDPFAAEHERMVKRVQYVNGRLNVSTMPDWLIKAMDKAKAEGKVANHEDYLRLNEVVHITFADDLLDRLMHAIDYLVAHTRRGENITARQVDKTLEESIRWGRSRAGEENDQLGALASNDKYNDIGPPHKLKLYLPFPDRWAWVQFGPATDSDYPTLAEAIPPGSMSSKNIYRLESKNPLLRRESYFMNHCIGAGMGAYGQRLKDGQAQYFSLRNQNNQPTVTVEMDGKRVLQIQGPEDKTPDVVTFGKVAAFLNKIRAFDDLQNANHGNVTRCGLIFSPKGFLSRDDFVKMSPQEMASYNLPKEVLRKMGLVQIGTVKVVRIEDCNDRSKVSIQELEQADLTTEELDRLGLIKTKNGLKSWETMGGETITSDMKFEGLATEIKFPNNISFERNVSFRAYPGKIIPSWTIQGTLTITGGEITTLAAGLNVRGKLVIKDCTRLTSIDGITCGALEISGATSLVKMDNVTVTGATQISGSNIATIGRNCKFGGAFDAGQSALESISPDCVFGSHVYLEKCPIKELKIREWPGSLILTGSAIMKLPDGMSVGASGQPDKESIAGQLALSNTKIKKLPDNLTINDSMLLPSSIKELPNGLVVPEEIVFHYGTIKKIPADCQFGKLVANHPKTGRPIFFWRKEYADRETERRVARGRPAPKIQHYVEPGDEIPKIESYEK